MPHSVLRPCTYPGCGNLVQSGRCVKHPYAKRKDARPSAHRRGYDGDWQRRRASYLRAHPVCEIRRKCRGERAIHVDHVEPLPTGTHEPDNLQAACHACHSWKTATHDTRRDDRGRFDGRQTSRDGR